MSGEQLFLAEGMITFGVVVGWGLWELYQLRKYNDKK